ncbi:protein MAIN-LIKE 1-like [Medicago truncatula]|uniref:protein MAIN-LIKE 1-like n=1 Tax=Medicago truncatula TaxID=3880 RepID=UPI000D2F2118|nr:protein MAIN-LIKE 1-like [Medicago truncatula]
MIDHGLICTFAERWHEETSSFHFLFGEITVTLDDVASLLHIPIDGMLLSHESVSRGEAMELMEKYLGSNTFDARTEVKMTKGEHCRFGYLEEIFKERLKEQRDLAVEYGVTEEVERLQDQYFRDLDLVSGFSWGAAALAHLYKELNNAARWNCSQVAGYLTLLHVWVFHHFPSMGSNDVWEKYVENEYPRAMLFLALSGLGIVDHYRNYLDALDLTRVVMAPYGEHRQARQFERVNLYSGWLRFGERMVRYLPERVFRQSGWVQTIPRHLVESAAIDVNLTEITNRFRHALDYALTPQQLGEPAVHGVEAEDGYIEWFYRHSYPRMILHDMPLLVSRPSECEILDARAAQEDGDLAYKFSGRRGNI